MKLYSFAHSPYAARVLIQIRAKGLDIDIVPPPGFKTPEYKVLNKTGKIPALDTGELIIPESEVILDYLEDKFPDRPLMPSDPEARARINIFVRSCDTYIQPALSGLFKLVFKRGDATIDVDSILDNIKAQIQLLEDFSIQYGRVNHTELDLADCVMAPLFRYVVDMCSWYGENDPFAACDNMKAWWEWCNEHEHIGAVLSDMDEGMKKFEAMAKA